MATDLSIDENLAGLQTAVARGASAARAAGLDATVPTCPTWDVRELVAHVGMVDRWAAAQLEGQGDAVGSGVALKGEGRESSDPSRGGRTAPNSWPRHSARSVTTSRRWCS